ncbi:hypothetical protein F444_00721 [Plasmopara halstedii]|uniref:PX domain-containing protein n=1 Tax=Plasmopara halstedii TaxID=4781 RepID=A0A0P1AQG4_PLAHL|nr:hypothetical protein F444_00721 [Plasmopara halstedii]CEG43566.1 hypothetical protein F444_00721 [Plasmopara halstedii]|eukprot:XP_024579935.1 hypothetical protein F444_00721 [Plasmopara halstedii]
MGCVQSKTEDVTTTNPPDVSAESKPIPADESKVEKLQAEEIETPAEVVEIPAEKIETPAEEIKTEVKPETSESLKDQYKITDHEINENGVVFYVVESETSFKKRFSDFKTLIVALGSPKNLPALPGSGLGAKLRGKHNPDLIQERKTQLAIVLNAIANDSKLADKEPFQKFVEC